MKIVAGVGIAFILLVGVVLSLPFLIDLNRYQDHYKPLIEEALNRKVQLQDIRLTVWPRLGARVGGFAVLDDPSFSSGPFAALTSLDVGVKLRPLLSGKVEIEAIALRDPVITVIKNKNGVMNVSTMGPKASAAPQPPKEAGPPPAPAGEPLQVLALLAVDRVSIDGGTLTYRDFSTTPVTEYQINNLELLLQSVHLGDTPTFHVGATVQPFRLPVTLDGSFGPLAQTLDLKHYDLTLGLGRIALMLKGALIGGKLDATLSARPFSTADVPVALPLTKPVQINDLRIVATAPYPLRQGVPALEMADVTDLGLAVAMGNSILNIKGSVLGGRGTVAVTAPSVNTADLPVDTGLKKPVEIKNLEVYANLKGQEAQVSNLSFQVFDGHVKAEGALLMGSAAPPFRGKVTIQELQLGPALHAVSPDGAVAVGGTAAMALAVAGRGFSLPDLKKALEGPGHIEVKDGRVEGVNLTQEALTLLNIAGISSDQAKVTAFSIVETDFTIKQGIVHVGKLLMDSHDFQATGSGTIGFDQILNLAVNLNLSPGLSQKIAGSSPVAKLALKEGRLKLPLRITGTTQKPSYGLDTKWLTGKMQEQAQEKVKETVEGLPKGTTKPEDLKRQGQDLMKDLFGR
jgi:uncharacterized protein involved in outer membrane biogenesis